MFYLLINVSIFIYKFTTVSALSPLACAILAPVVADWASSIASNSLWLDNRITVKKALFSSLPLLILKASELLNKNKNKNIILSDKILNSIYIRQSVICNNIEDQIFMYFSETIMSCIMALSVQTPGLDPYATGCILKSLRLCRISSSTKENESIDNNINEAHNKGEEENDDNNNNNDNNYTDNNNNNNSNNNNNELNYENSLGIKNEITSELSSLNFHNSLINLFPSDNFPSEREEEKIKEDSVGKMTDKERIKSIHGNNKGKFDEKDEEDDMILKQLKESLSMISNKYCRKQHLTSMFTPIAIKSKDNRKTSHSHSNSNSSYSLSPESFSDCDNGSESKNEIENKNESYNRNGNENNDNKNKRNDKNNDNDESESSYINTERDEINHAGLSSIFNIFNVYENDDDNDNNNNYDNKYSDSDSDDDNEENISSKNYKNKDNESYVSDKYDNNEDMNNKNDNNSDDSDDDDFSDWDEDEVEIEVKTSCITRRSSFCLFDDITIMEVEMEKLLFLIR